MLRHSAVALCWISVVLAILCHAVLEASESRFHFLVLPLSSSSCPCFLSIPVSAVLKDWTVLLHVDFSCKLVIQYAFFLL